MNKSDVSGIVVTLPILPGKVEAWRRFCQEMAGSRLKQFMASRRRLGITRERMALLETSYGSMAVTTIETQDAFRVFDRMIISGKAFDVWYRNQLNDLHGINLAEYRPSSESPGPERNLKIQFEWTEEPSPAGSQSAMNTENTKKEKDDER